MIGNNELHINQVTMVEAMQMWIDASMTDPPKVTNVVCENSPSGHGFVIRLESKPVAVEP